MVRHTFIAFVSFIVMTAVVYSRDGGAIAANREYFSDCNIEVVDSLSGNKIQLARQRDVVLSEGFNAPVSYGNGKSKSASDKVAEWRYTPKDGWGFENYRNALTPFISNEKGTQNSCLIIRGTEGDTAFELASPKVPIEADKKYTLNFRCKFNKRMTSHYGFKGNYETSIIWFDSNHRKLDETAFSLLCEAGNGTDWYTKTIEVVSPEDAKEAIIRFGFDLPNLGKGDFVCFDDIRFATLSNKYQSDGEFVSRPFQIKPGALSLTAHADIPEGTFLRLQLRFAADNNGVPGDWSSFTGPDGALMSYYDLKSNDLRFSITADQRWLQYRAVLHTTKLDTTPALHSVTIHNSNSTNLTDSGWSGPDTTPPEIIWRSPTRTEKADAPISFRLCDNASGLGVESVKAYLDGEEVELLRSESNENEYTLKTTGLLKPIDRSRELSTWRVENYQDALTVEQTPEVITVRSKSKDDAYVDTAFKVQSPQIPVRENTKYVLSFYLQHNLELIQLQHWGEISSGIIWRDCNGKETGEPYSASFGVAHMKWHRDVHKVVSPSDAVSAEICFGWDSPNLKRGDFFSVKDISLNGPRPETICEPNLHKIEVKACDLAGNTMQKTWYMLVKRLPEKNIVTLRDDGITLIDNKPFFPIGIYAVQKSKVNSYNFDNAFKELKDAGFNTAHTYMKERNNDFSEFYSAAERYGIKVLVMPSTGHNSTDIDIIVRDVATEVYQPALLSWYLADDTASHISAKDLKSVHVTIKDIDPYHLTSQADWVSAENRYKGYVNSTDIFLAELYPIGKKGGGGVPEVIKDMNTVKDEIRKTGQNRGVWAIVQDFKGWGWERYPTDEELRAMTYLSIIHGATGITYYTYGGWGNNFGAPYDENVWNNLKNVVGELAYLHDVLAERNTTETCVAQIVKGADKDDLGYPAINTLLKVYQGKHYLFTANSAQHAIRCQFASDTKNISVVTVLFECRTLPVKDGVFVDDFKAYEVHAYRW